jgi:hypothetical protein
MLTVKRGGRLKTYPTNIRQEATIRLFPMRVGQVRINELYRSLRKVSSYDEVNDFVSIFGSVYY